jgi:hypothetical protein
MKKGKGTEKRRKLQNNEGSKKKNYKIGNCATVGKGKEESAKNFLEYFYI